METLKLKNNLIFAPVKLGYCYNKDGVVTQKHLNFYNARSKHAGAVTLEPLYIHSGLREIPGQLGIDSDDKIAGLKILNEIIHKNGAKTIANLNHPGRLANPTIPGNFYVSSTSAACENGGAIPKEMNENDISDAIQLVCKAAQRSEKAGFDIIELQLGHGYLSAQFLSGSVNKRTDKYGGNLENRMRFSTELFEAVKQSVKIPVIVRITAYEQTSDGITIEEAVCLTKKLKEKGAEIFHIVAGSGCSSPPWFFQHMFVPKGKTWEAAQHIKNQTGVKIISVGKVTNANDINKLTKINNSDFVSVGRALVADPDFFGKYLGIVKENIKPCLSCSEGCLGGVRSGKGLGCIVNPLIGKEETEIKFAAKSKKIAIAGGGPAGIEAAIQLCKRGHNVTIFEKNSLGGQLNLAYLPPQKESMKELLNYYISEIYKCNINIIFKELNSENFDFENFDQLVIATGAIPATPKIKGLKKYFWTEFLLDENLPENKTFLIIGGGMIGVETASKLIDKNNKVIITEMLDELATGMEMLERKMILNKLAAKNVIVYTGSKIEEIINDNSAKVIGKTNTIIQNIDYIIVTTGMKSVNSLYEQFKNKIPTHIIGDAVKPRKIQEAVSEGFETGILI